MPLKMTVKRWKAGPRPPGVPSDALALLGSESGLPGGAVLQDWAGRGLCGPGTTSPSATLLFRHCCVSQQPPVPATWTDVISFSFPPPDAATVTVTGVCPCWGGAFLPGVTTLTWACPQDPGPMDLKEKRAVGVFGSLVGVACVSLALSLLAFAWEVLIERGARLGGSGAALGWKAEAQGAASAGQRRPRLTPLPGSAFCSDSDSTWPPASLSLLARGRVIPSVCSSPGLCPGLLRAAGENSGSPSVVREELPVRLQTQLHSQREGGRREGGLALPPCLTSGALAPRAGSFVLRVSRSWAKAAPEEALWSLPWALAAPLSPAARPGCQGRPPTVRG